MRRGLLSSLSDVRLVRTKIRAAIQLLRENGWCRYSNEDDMGRHCLNGAVTMSGQMGVYQARTFLNELAHRRLEEWGLVDEPVSLGYRSLTTFNDLVPDSGDEAIAFLEDALEELGRIEEGIPS